MKIRINGELKDIEGPVTLDQLLDQLRLHRGTVVCELNRSIVSKVQYPEIYLNESDSLEIVHFVGGG